MLTGELDDETFGLDIGLSRDKTVNRGRGSDRVFAAEERRANSNRFLNEVRLNHAIRDLVMDEQLDFWGSKRRMKSMMSGR
jgi:hypothetical protein